jgi:hypothetical protein
MASFLTRADVDNYGAELLDVSQRAEMQAVAPHLQNLEAQNAQLQQRLAREARHRLDMEVGSLVPNYREVDRNPQWHAWLSQIDPLTGRVRQHVLNDAINAGSAARVKAFFDGFQREVGHAPQTARAASTATSHRPTYTRPAIAELYARHRRGEFTEKVWQQIEADIFRAQHEGRVQGSPYLTK